MPQIKISRLELSGNPAQFLSGSGTWATAVAQASSIGVIDSATIDFSLTSGSSISGSIIPAGIILDTLGAPTDITTSNATSGRHGFLPKLSGVPAQFLSGSGTWLVPASGSTAGGLSSISALGTASLSLWVTSGSQISGSSVVGGHALDTHGAGTDVTTNNATSGAHGLLPKLSGVPTQFFSGSGTWLVPAAAITATSSASLFLNVSGSVVSGSVIAGGHALDTHGAATDITTNNATSGAHGLLPKLSGVPTQFFSGSGTYLVPAGLMAVTNSKSLALGGNFGVAWAKYNFSVDGSAVGTKTPGATANTTIPANAILVSSTINVTTAVTSSGSASVAIGCAGTGGSTTTLMVATAKPSLGANVVINGAVTFAAPKKLTGAGGITFTIATAALTAGVIEVFSLYYLASA